MAGESISIKPFVQEHHLLSDYCLVRYDAFEKANQFINLSYADVFFPVFKIS